MTMVILPKVKLKVDKNDGLSLSTSSPSFFSWWFRWNLKLIKKTRFIGIYPHYPHISNQIPTPLKNMNSLVGIMTFPTEWKIIIHSCSKAPTRHHPSWSLPFPNFAAWGPCRDPGIPHCGPLGGRWSGGTRPWWPWRGRWRVYWRRIIPGIESSHPINYI